jgi:hypothetical protein
MEGEEKILNLEDIVPLLQLRVTNYRAALSGHFLFERIVKATTNTQ